MTVNPQVENKPIDNSIVNDQVADFVRSFDFHFSVISQFFILRLCSYNVFQMNSFIEPFKKYIMYEYSQFCKRL